jgi:large subunit ribosomal protein L3
MARDEPLLPTATPSTTNQTSTEIEETDMAKKAIVGEKVGMTQLWDDQNNVVPVTVVRVAPARVVQVKTPDRDGYAAIQVTYGAVKASRISKPEQGHFDAAGVVAGKGLREFRVDDAGAWTVGQEFAVDILEVGELVDVTAYSKGQGFTGTMKRHNFSSQRASHGAHRTHRTPGSIGACATPGRVWKGLKMAGRDGGLKTTTQNLVVVRADVENGLLLVKGAVPGPKGSSVLIRSASKGGK